MSRKNIWTKDVLGMLKERAMTSNAISYKLQERHRYAPHSRKVTLVLRSNKLQFRELGKVSVDSTTRRDSHSVSLWGLAETKYMEKSPFLAMRTRN